MEFMLQYMYAYKEYNMETLQYNMETLSRAPSSGTTPTIVNAK